MRITIKAKLWLSFGLLLTFIGAAGFLGVSSLAFVNDRMQGFAGGPFLQVQRVGKLETQIFDNARLLNLTLATQDDAGKATRRKQFNEGAANFDVLVKQYQDRMPVEGRSRLQPLIDVWSQYLAEANKTFDLTQLNSQNKANTLASVNGVVEIRKFGAALEALADKSRGGPHEADVARMVARVHMDFASAQSLAYLIIIATDDEVIKGLMANYKEALDRLSATMTAFVAPGDGTLSASFDAVRTSLQSVRALNDEMVRLGAVNSDFKASAIATGTVADARRKSTEEVQLLRSYEDGVAKTFIDETTAAYERTRVILVSLVATALVLGLGIAGWIAISIARGMKESVEVANAVANGDLTTDVAIRGNDEIADLKHAIKRMIDSLRAVVGSVSGNAAGVSSGSEELSTSSEQMSQGATEQASAAEEASASMEEMASIVKQNADNASQTEAIARQSATDAEASGAAVVRAVEAMQVIASKITIVQEIARQTDLLALNAAVEAARAGEHGRGFAVVASEVRKLAERSQTAAQEIGSLSTETVKAAQEAGAMLSRLVPDIKRTASLVGEITAACREQDIGATQINQAIQQLDKVTQQNASASGEVAATAESLSSQAIQLQDAIAFFKIAARPEMAPGIPGARPASGAATNGNVSKLRATAVAMRREAPRPLKTFAPPVGAERPKRVANGGFALDLRDPSDALDGEFERP